MRSTKQFKSLKRRYSQLIKNFIPTIFSPTGQYTLRVEDLARGFMVLFHAEVEYYIEDVVRTIVLKHMDIWNTSKKPTSVIVSMIACYKYGWDVDFSVEPVGDKNKRNVADVVDCLIKSACDNFFAVVIGKNNGVKIDNLKKMLIPIGVDYDSLDTVWLGDMNSFGSSRGDVAHKASGVQQKIDPAFEFLRASRILNGLDDLDKEFVRLLSLK